MLREFLPDRDHSLCAPQPCGAASHVLPPPRRAWGLLLAPGLALALFAALAPPVARADLIRLKDGKTLEGVIVGTTPRGDESSGTLRLKVGSTQIVLPARQIAGIRQDTPAQNSLIEAKAHLAAQRPAEATALLAQAVTQGIKPEILASVIERHGDEVATAIPTMDGATRSALSRVLSALEAVQVTKDDELLTRRLYLHLCLGEREKARALLERIGPVALRGNTAMREQLAQWLANSLGAWADAGEYARGEETLLELRQVDPVQARARATQFYMQWASHERDGGRFETALQLYVQHIMDDTPGIARDRIEVTLREAERRAREQDRLGDVTRLYETYGLPARADFARGRLVTIWHDLGWEDLWRSRFAEARAAFDKAEQLKPGSMKNDLAQLEYRERRAKLADDDLVGHYELGVWCLAHELIDPALKEFNQAEPSKAVGANARANIGKIRNLLAEADLTRIMDLYDKHELTTVLQELQEFMTKDYPTGYLTQAKEIQDMTKEAIRVRVAERPQQAQSLYEQAQRAFHKDDYAKADQLLQDIFAHYRDTPAYAAARTFQALVQDKLALASLEKGQTPNRADTRASDASTTTGVPARGEIDRLVRTLGPAATQEGKKGS